MTVEMLSSSSTANAEISVGFFFALHINLWLFFPDISFLINKIYVELNCSTYLNVLKLLRQLHNIWHIDVNPVNTVLPDIHIRV